MSTGFPPYRNKRKTLARTIGRIAIDLMDFKEKVFQRFDSNAYSGGSAYTDPDSDVGCACCDRAVVVSPDDNGDFSSIQDAIDFAVTETPSASEPWIIHICPGVYTENLTGADFVSLVGLGTKSDGVRVQGTYDFPGQESSLENIEFRPNASIAVPLLTGGSINTDKLHIRNCSFVATYDTTAARRFIELLFSNEYIFDDCYFEVRLGGSVVGAQTHELFYFDGPTTVYFRDSEFKIYTEDDDDTYRVFSLNAGDVDFRFFNNIALFQEEDVAGNTSTVFFYINDTGGNEYFVKENHIKMYRVNAGGNHVIFNLAGLIGHQIMYSHHNNYSSNATAQNVGGFGINTLYMFYDDINDIPIPGLAAPGAGVFEFIVANDGSDGSSEHIWGPLSIANPPRAKACVQIAPIVIPGVGAAQVVFDAVLYDSHFVATGTQFYNPAIGTFTVPINGCYHITSTLEFDFPPGPAVDFTIQIWINGVPRKEFKDDFPGLAPTLTRSISVDTYFELLAGDLITCWVILTAPGTILNDILGLYSTMSVHKHS